MIFISSQLPLAELEVKTKEEILNQDWFVFNTFVKKKSDLTYEQDITLFYTHFYKEKLYTYLMTDHYYYYKSKLFKILDSSARISCMRKTKLFEEIEDFDKEVIKQEERIFGEKDIRDMINSFERNNFRENPICEYVLG